MTEAEWLTCADPQAMLKVLQGKASLRKLRLFACACYRRLLAYRGAEPIHPAFQVSEEVADGSLAHRHLREARTTLGGVGAYSANAAAAEALHATLDDAASVAASTTATSAADFFGHLAVEEAKGGLFVNRDLFIAARRTEQAAQAALVRDIFGLLPFRSRGISEAWLRWNGRTVERLAEAVYQERELPGGHLDPARLGILADAVEEAGCDDADILGHLRQRGSIHVRGCWTIDLLLGRD
jgi:hypothetical protein